MAADLVMHGWLGREVQRIGSEVQEAQRRIEAERLTLEFRTKSTRRLDAGKAPMSESPLFGGSAQKELFSA